MLLYRVFFHDATAKPGHSGSAQYLHKPQGGGRWDNPHLYDAWYLAKSPEAAIGETFGNLATWSTGMFDTGTGARRAMATFEVPDDLAIFDFDDAANLQRIGMRPSAVVIRNTPATQARATDLFNERNPDGSRRWAALQWWSYHSPHWQNLMLWATPTEPAPLTLVDVMHLSLTSPSVAAAAKTLRKISEP